MDKVDRSRWGHMGKDAMTGRDINNQLADKIDEIVEFLSSEQAVVKDKVFEVAETLSELVSKIPKEMPGFSSLPIRKTDGPDVREIKNE